MGTTAQKLQAIANSKAAIKSAIEAKGVSDVGNKLSDYAGKITAIPVGGGDPRFEVNQSGQIVKKQFVLDYLSNATSVPGYTMDYGFYKSSVTSIDLSSLTSIGDYAMQRTFQACTSLTTVDLSSLTSILSYGLSYGFASCTSLTKVYLTKLSSVGSSGLANAFQSCNHLELVDFSQATAVPAISTNTFQSTNTTFKIVVPDALYDSWIVATNWSSRASQIVKASQYTPSN